jgi:calcium-dependent protein kinase
MGMGGCCNKRAIETKFNEKPIVIEVNKKFKRRKSSIFKENFTKFSDYKEKYKYISDLGEGSFGEVRLFCDKIHPNLLFAIKTLKKDLLQTNNILCLIDEVKILRSVDHPNIVKYFETYEEECNMHIVTEYIPGYNMNDLIKYKNRVFNQNEIQCFTVYILKALSFLHRMNITHRDLKPENILLSDESDLSSVKLIDFGLSALEKKKEKYRVGSPYYMAPEMVYGNYSPASDMWSLGVILFLLTTGSQPFEGKNSKEIYKNIRKGNYDTDALIRRKLNNELIDFIEKLLIVNESERLKSDEAFEHIWILKYTSKIEVQSASTLNETIIDSLRCFSKNNILQKEILFYLAKICNEKELVSLRKAFEALDYDNKGVIEYKQIEKLFSDQKIKASKVKNNYF